VDASAVQSAAGSWCTEIPGGPSAACTARELLTDRLGDHTAAGTMHDLHLLATELITNAVLHARVDESATVELRVVPTKAGLHVSVTDPGAETRPEVQQLDPSVPGGMGLFLVEQISTGWGVERTPAGENRVWFELAG
jgi:anti-sigma regulatory factor (Ser/Thr protein kinase)